MEEQIQSCGWAFSDGYIYRNRLLNCFLQALCFRHNLGDCTVNELTYPLFGVMQNSSENGAIGKATYIAKFFAWIYCTKT